MEQFLRYYLPAFIAVYLMITFVLPSVRVYKRTGINPITFGKSDSAHDYIGGVMKLLTVLSIVCIILFSISKELYHHLVPIEYLQTQWLKYIGIIFIHLSFVWIMIAQQHMRDSWRIGIDQNNKTNLVTKGLFQASRNPIFLGMIVSTLGLFFILPNALMLFVAATSFIVIQIQIRLEEAYLLNQHGDIYKAYMSKVRRIL